MKRILIALLTMGIFAGSCCNAPEEADKVRIVIDNIMSRKSVRSYTSEPVPQEMVETLLRAGMAAPTAMNRQPWEFVVINDRDTLDKLAGGLRHAKMLAEAPLAIVVCAETMITLKDGTVVENNFWEHDASAATENILLAAEALGLGAVWTAATDDRAAIVKDCLGITGTVQPLCVIPIGFPAGDEQPKDKWKPEKIHYNRW